MAIAYTALAQHCTVTHIITQPKLQDTLWTDFWSQRPW